MSSSKPFTAILQHESGVLESCLLESLVHHLVPYNMLQGMEVSWAWELALSLVSIALTARSSTVFLAKGDSPFRGGVDLSARLRS
ncbi:hypothetical protein CC2G_012819 [Coprinopsis cinerea AmutBmut pab1-1]|nr:hypothetical protein CC2G_012819 [Coprinopsis cinerea AmutBmut pab1-1]